MNTNDYVTIDFQVDGHFWADDSRLCLEDGYYLEAIDYQKIAAVHYAAARQLQGIK